MWVKGGSLNPPLHPSRISAPPSLALPSLRPAPLGQDSRRGALRGLLDRWRQGAAGTLPYFRPRRKWGKGGERELSDYMDDCTIRDHADKSRLGHVGGCGVIVEFGGGATVGTDCVFASNAGGNVVGVGGAQQWNGPDLNMGWGPHF